MRPDRGLRKQMTSLREFSEYSRCTSVTRHCETAREWVSSVGPDHRSLPLPTSSSNARRVPPCDSNWSPRLWSAFYSHS